MAKQGNKPKYEKTDTRFVNPYNFVPVTFDKVLPAAEQSDKSLLTGYFECRIKCRTPLAIPDICHKEGEILSGGAQTKDGKRDDKIHYKYPFYRAGGDIPIIPGSSIRGVIRSVYETLTDSCFGTMKEDTYITARTEEAFGPGLLMREIRDGKSAWALYEAERCLLPVNVIAEKKDKKNYKSGMPVDFKSYYKQKARKTYIEDFWHAADQKNPKGYFCAVETSPNRKYASIFKLKNKDNNQLKPVTAVANQDLERLEMVLAEYRNESINRKKKEGEHGGYPDYEYAKKEGIIPVYYKQDEKLYLSFAALGRRAFYNTLNQVVGARSHQNCDKRADFCPACRLFGSIEGEKLGSKIRFTDALCINFNESMLKTVCFSELSSPKISYFPFYMENMKDDWEEYARGYDSDIMKIRGRKFYWHHEPDTSTSIEKSNRNASFEILKAEAQFQFRVYFDGITGAEMQLLAEAIHLDENVLAGHRCQKMGHGKPLGYGSVKMIVEQCRIRTFAPETGWKEKEEQVPCVKRATCSDDTYDSLMTICDFESYKKFGNAKVEYPSVENGGKTNSEENKEEDQNKLAAHQWFSNNYKKVTAEPQKPEKMLPKIAEEVGKERSKFLYTVRLTSQTDSSKNSQSQPVKDDKKVVYHAEILTEGKPGKNENFLCYKIKILDNDYFKERECILTEHKSKMLKVSANVEVTLFKGVHFNLKKR